MYISVVNKLCDFRDLRAKLEIAIEKVMELGKQQEHTVYQDSDYNSDSEEVSNLHMNEYFINSKLKEVAKFYFCSPTLCS